jgi:hypothetical protein
VAEFSVSVLWCDDLDGDELLLFAESVLSRLLACESGDLRRLLLLCEADVGELWAERYKLPEEGRVRIGESDRLAIALEVLSRANAARENRPLRFGFAELVESVAWRCL